MGQTRQKLVFSKYGNYDIRDASVTSRGNCYSCLSLCRGLIESRDKKRNSQKYKFFSNMRHCFIELIIYFQSALDMHSQDSRKLWIENCGFQKVMHGAHKAKMTEELKNFLKVFFLPYSLSKKIWT